MMELESVDRKHQRTVESRLTNDWMHVGEHDDTKAEYGRYTSENDQHIKSYVASFHEEFLLIKW